ncbi:DNA-processing protein DprA [Lactobacillus sp. 3B(2020)]|uniref:DNA-processing protein DprA n=1 Tax=Lactobacillus sp. 3B(2020) TaxID=2695882 RepID=UPI0015DE119F|nr:DNA-processing protein DprA [Lactobacillus sp. 3B(2020)]QLL70064.1 DNA-protecting protein DprA [Lactobacillus sp. 3B(2020)]
MEAREFLYRLSLVRGIGLVTKGSIWKAAQASQRYDDLAVLASEVGLSMYHTADLIANFYGSELDQQLTANTKVPSICILDDEYPDQLKEIAHPPLVLYYQGDISLLKKRSLAVVGTRKQIQYGRMASNLLLPVVVKQGYPIISGLAKGMDTIAHQFTLENGGKTIGVIGTGLDRFYPLENQELHHQVAEKGVLITEYPLGSEPLPYHFPERNRIIAGLCTACLVLMAKEKSGSLITANLALQENRNVLAVPGLVTVSYSAGCNQLIAAGARSALSSKDILEELATPIADR